MIPDLDRNSWALMIFDRVDLEAIRQVRVSVGERRNGDLLIGLWIVRTKRRKEQGQKEKQRDDKDSHEVRYRSELRSECELFPCSQVAIGNALVFEAALRRILRGEWDSQSETT